jgi:hypothetical protein
MDAPQTGHAGRSFEPKFSAAVQKERGGVFAPPLNITNNGDASNGDSDGADSTHKRRSPRSNLVATNTDKGRTPNALARPVQPCLLGLVRLASQMQRSL